MHARSALLLWLCVADAAAWAAPTGLTTIPTADLVPVRQLTAQVQNANTEIRGSASLVRRPEPAVQTQAGLLPRCEAGVDVAPVDSPSDYRPLFNLKGLVLREDYQWPAVAVGVAQLGPGVTPVYYLAVSRTLNYEQLQYQKFRAHHRNIKLRGVRLHAGVQGTADVPRGFAGLDIEASDHFVLYADWISGREHAATLGGVVVIDQENSLQAAAFYGNRDNRIDGVLVTLTHTFSW